MYSFQRPQSVAPNLDIRPLAGRIGAEIDGVQLAGNLPEATIAAIEAVLAKYKVIFFRDQCHLDDAGQERFAARLGELIAHPTSPAKAGSAAILEIDSARARADRWHTDVTFVDAYPKISVLRGVVIPPCGGDTMWANTVAAYDGLPAALKTLAENLWAIHSNLLLPRVLHLDGLRDRASACSRASQRRALACPWLFLPPLRRCFANSLVPPVRDFPIPHHATRKHGSLALELRRCGNLGQYRDPALGHQRLRRGEAGGSPLDHHGRGTDQCRWP
jgi:hypothetical protein